MASRDSSDTLPVGRFQRNTSRTPFVSVATLPDGRRLLASESNSTNSPASEITGRLEAPSPRPLNFECETIACRGWRPARLASKTSEAPLVSPPARLLAVDSYATYWPLSLTDGLVEGPLPTMPRPLADTRMVL